MALRKAESSEHMLFNIWTGKIDVISRGKHSDKDWKEMKLSYIIKKFKSHLRKLEICLSAKDFDLQKAMLHMVKLGWYSLKGLWIMRYRPDQNDLAISQKQITSSH